MIWWEGEGGGEGDGEDEGDAAVGVMGVSVMYEGDGLGCV